MNLKCLCLLLSVLTVVTVFGQRVVENPVFGGRTTESRNITAIELSDTATVVCMELVYRPNLWIVVDSLSYIRTSDGKDKLPVKQAVGIPLNEKFLMPESGRLPFKFIFPPLTQESDYIDLIGEDGDGIYDIALTAAKEQEMIPADLKGNWLRADGSGIWEYAFEKLFAVAENGFWEYAKVKTKGRTTEFYLKNGKQKKIIYARREDNGAVWLGENKKELKEFRRDRLTLPEAVQKADEDFATPLLRPGVAVLNGFIKGYVPKMGKRKVSVYVDDVFSGKQDMSEYEVMENGCFHIGVELNHPQVVFLRFPFGMDVPVLMEPGKETMMCLDMAQYIDPWREKGDIKLRPKTSLFMGSNAYPNSDYQYRRQFYDVEYRRLQGVVKVVTPQQYKQHIYQLRDLALKQLADYDSTKGLSRKGKELITNFIGLSACRELLRYDELLRLNWEEENKGKKREEIPAFRPPLLGIGYYDFIRNLDLANEKLLLTGSLYGTIVSWIKNSGVVRTLNNNLSVKEVVVEMVKSGIDFSQREQEFLELLVKIQESRGQDTAAMHLLYTDYKEDNTTFNTKYGQLMNDVQEKNGRMKKLEMLDTYFGVKAGLVTEIMTLQDKVQLLSASFSPLSDEYLAAFKQESVMPFTFDYLVRYNDRLKAKLQENKSKTGYESHETPGVENEKLFEAMLRPFKGKAVFVDFWATWCAPCQEGIKAMKGIKEDLQGKDIVFVYITGETSPLNTYENMIPDIKGHHFRLNEESWTYLCNYLKIDGIPRYMLFDKSGKVVEEKYNAWKESDLVKSDLLKLAGER